MDLLLADFSELDIWSSGSNESHVFLRGVVKVASLLKSTASGGLSSRSRKAVVRGLVWLVSAAARDCLHPTIP